MIRREIFDNTFIRCDNLLRHKRTIHGAGDQELADKDFDSDFEQNDGKFEGRVKDLIDSENMDQ